MQTHKLRFIQSNDYISEVGTDFGPYKDDIDNELIHRYQKQQLKEQRAFRRKQRQELKRLEETLPF